MIRKTINNILGRRRFWQDLSYNELSQLYISMVFRSLGNSVVGIFVPVFLYKLGYQLHIIFAFFAVCYLFMMVGNLLGAFVTATYGPKRTMGFSYIVHSCAMLFLASINYLSLPIWVTAGFLGVANGMFFTAYHVNFSKIKNRRSGGSEIGYMTIVEKMGGIVGPMVGGIISTLFAPEYAFMAAITLYVFGLVPLTATGETVRLRQELKFGKRDMRPLGRDLISAVGVNVHSAINSIAWPLFIAIVVFSGGVYIKLGILSTLSAVTMIIVAYTVGKLIDEKRGRLLLRSGAVFNAALNIFRPFVSGVGGVAAVAFGQEIADVATRLPFTKGYYDAADQRESERITYIAAVEYIAAGAKALALSLVALIAWSFPNIVFVAAFIFASMASLLIMAERFVALRSS